MKVKILYNESEDIQLKEVLIEELKLLPQDLLDNLVLSRERPSHATITVRKVHILY